MTSSPEILAAEPSDTPTPMHSGGKRLSDEQVRALAVMLDAGCYSTRQMAAAINANRSTVSRFMRSSKRVNAAMRALRARNQAAQAAQRQRRKRARAGAAQQAALEAERAEPKVITVPGPADLDRKPRNTLGTDLSLHRASAGYSTRLGA